MAQPEPVGPVALTVSPAAAPVPALKYELLPKGPDKHSGNAAVGYYQAILLRPSGPKDPAVAKKQAEKEESFRTVPIEELSARELTELLKPHRASFRIADHAAAASRCDWQRENQLSGEDLFSIFPDLQQHRELAGVMALRIRLAAAEDKFDEATLALRTGLVHAKHVGEGPTFLHLLVGLAMANVQLKRVEDVMQRPGSPNYYWALTTLPRPFVDPRPACDGEEIYLESVLPGLKAIERGPVTSDQAAQAIETLFQSLKDANENNVGRSLATKLGVVGYAALYHEQAKKELVEKGWPAKSLDAMPPTQIVLLRGIGIYRELKDELKKLYSLPYPVAAKTVAAMKDRVKTLKDGSDPLAALFSLAVPAGEKIFEAHARTERRIALLRAVEAVRLYAAAHNGQPPKALADVPVPVPDDPLTGTPFEYKATGTVATLTAPPPAGETANAINAMGFVVTVRK
jgi:hypothetical protein